MKGWLQMRLGELRALGQGILRVRETSLETHAYEEIKAAIGCLTAAPIPRVIHQIWLGPKRPPWYTMETCRMTNPDWLYVVWTEDNLPPMVNRRVFDAFGRTYCGKADILRYEVLFRFGGVYVDADQLCLRSFDDLLGAEDAFFAGYQYFGNPDLDDDRRGSTVISNAVIGASAAHPIIEQVISDIGASPPEAKAPPWLTVGPRALTKAIEKTPVRAVVHPFYAFYPYHYTEEIPTHPDDMLKVRHYGSHSVSLWGSTLDNYGRCRRRPSRDGGSLFEGREVPAKFAERHPALKPVIYHG